MRSGQNRATTTTRRGSLQFRSWRPRWEVSTSNALAATPQGGTSPKRTNCHPQLLEEKGGASCRVLPWLGCNGLGDVLQHNYRVSIPSTCAFSNHGDKADSLYAARLCSLKVNFFVPGITRGSSQGILARLGRWGAVITTSRAEGNPTKAGKKTSAGRRRAL